MPRRTGSADLPELFRALGYPVQLVPVSAQQWTDAGVRVPWPPGALQSLARLERTDLFLLRGSAQTAEIEDFLHDYRKYNCVIKPYLIHAEGDSFAHLYSLSPRNRLRRFSFNPAQPSAHAADRLQLLTLHPEWKGDVSVLFDRALDREAVTRQFFLRFRSAVASVAEALRKSCPAAGHDEARAQALLVLSRLLFLSFIQEKGWLNGERRFLVDRVERALRSGEDFFHTVLQPLFFGCLNTPALQRDAVARRLGSIPYLNGGLFEPSSFERAHPRAHLPAELLREIIEELFERFDFRVDESDGRGTEVDPEMLGKVFESLMAADERSVSGSFYTPREIVDVLTRSAIATWLSAGDESLGEQLRELAEGGLNTISDRIAAALLEQLETITVLDPACGSGAFLLSALQVIETLVVALSRGLGRTVPHDLRQRIVERSLYGVDLKPEAVRLCELRLWLAIVAGREMPLEEIRPLPNLDRNIRQGNSLLAPLDFLGASRLDLYAQWSAALRAQRDLVERYRAAGTGERPALARLLRVHDQRLACELLGRAVQQDEAELQRASAPRPDLFGMPSAPDRSLCQMLQQRIRASKGLLERAEEGEIDFFAFDLHFAPVMAAGGFNLVIGNPPWVRHHRIPPDQRAVYRQRYATFDGRGRSAAFHQPDLSMVFFERSIRLLAPGGAMALLMPGKMAGASYAEPLRRLIESQLDLVELVDWSADPRGLFAADTFPLGVVATRQRTPRRAVRCRAASLPGEERIDPPQLHLLGSEWSIVPGEVARILRRIASRFAPLREALGRSPVMGVKTGQNARFFLEMKAIESGWFTTADDLQIPTEYICRCVRGRAVRRWSTAASQWMLWPPVSGWKGAPQWLQQLAVRQGVEPEDLRLSFVRPEHVGVKVVWKDVSRGMSAVVLPESVSAHGHCFPLVPNQTLYTLDASSMDEAYVVASVLNSVVVDSFLLALAERAKDHHFRYFGRTVGRVPIPPLQPGEESWSSLLRDSRAAHRSGRAPDSLERAVCDLYGVSEKEAEVLRGFVARCLAAD